MVREIEAQYGAAMAHTARAVQVSSAEDQTKGQILMRLFEKNLDNLLKEDLSMAGIAHTSKIYAGGISVDDKDTVESDTDRVDPAFYRGIHGDPDIEYTENGDYDN
jgi:hypothetical protein